MIKMAWIEPFTTRDVSDIDHLNYLITKGYSNFTAEELAEWMAGVPGALGMSDLNRIEGNMAILATDLSLTITTKTDWTYTDVMTSITDTLTGDVQRILSNLQALCDAVTLPDYAPAIPEPPLNSYSRLNDIEYLIDIINQTLPTPH